MPRLSHGKNRQRIRRELPFRSPQRTVSRASVDIGVSPTTAALVLTGFAPTVATPRAVVPGVATLVLTGKVAAIAAPRVLTPGKATLALSTFAPSVAAPRLVTPGKSSLVLTGFAPSANASVPVSVVPQAAALVLTGYSPDVAGDLRNGELGHVVSDTGRRLRFPIADELPEPVEITPGAARLTLKTYAPAITKASAVAFTLEELAGLADALTEEEFAVLLAA